METLVLIIGGNLGDRLQNISVAYRELQNIFGNAYLRSDIYETAAWGGKSTGSYLNQALVFQVRLPPLDILNAIQQIEKAMGRTRKIKWGDRNMDIDILFYGNKIITKPDLTVPHPLVHQRKFVLQPLCEILPDFVHPTLHKTLKALMEVCTDQSEVTIYKKIEKG